jgi:hypothetical protein
MKLSIATFFILIISLVFESCSEKKTKAAIAFYHWKAEMDISQSEIEYLNALSVKKLYVRFFDVKWDNEKQKPIPISSVQWNSFEAGRSLEIIPVVFITNKSIEKLQNDPAVDSLAKKISTKLSSMLKKLDVKKFPVNELQLDCDWSPKTEKAYFRLIEQMKKNMPELKKISATIRLHQVKYFNSTGVPPVDEGVLMFYNMGDLTKENEKNSILNIEKAKTYLENFDIYPLKLNVALPLFSWAVQLREGRTVQLINDISEADLTNNSNFTQIEPAIFKVINSNYLKGIYLYKNDKIRLESISEKDLKESVKILRKAFGNKPFDIIYYHLDDYIVQRYDKATIKSILEN